MIKPNSLPEPVIFADSFICPLQRQTMHPSIGAKLDILRNQAKDVALCFQQFKEQTMHEFNKAVGKISSLIYRQVATNGQLRQELDVVKNSNHLMKKEVVQLRQMIEEFVKSYNTEIQGKDAQIKELKTRLGQFVDQKPNNLALSYEQNSTEEKSQTLDVIQEVSEYTASCMQSIREQSSSINSNNTSSRAIISNQSRINESPKENWEEEKGNKSKNFIKFFRKNLDQNGAPEEHHPSSKQSHDVSIQETYFAETDKINMPKTIKSPKHIQLFQNRSKSHTQEDQKQNLYVEIKTPHRRNLSDTKQHKSDCKSQKQSRSSSKGCSKQKIKLSSKIIEESQNFSKVNKKSSGVTMRPSVHLGGKMHLKKLTKQIRTALQDYKVWEGLRSKEVKYQGQKKNGMRWGKGKLLYDNGFEYEGSFVQNYKHGIGTVSLNGIVFYEGQWSLDQISGRGYIKSLKNYSQNCSKYLWEASYCGQLLQNKPHGMGTLFINQNQKFVTKFIHGVPVGDFTYYNHSQIQFNSWF